MPIHVPIARESIAVVVRMVAAASQRPMLTAAFEIKFP